LYFNHCSYPIKTCNPRLRILFELHCIDRLFPPVAVGEGSSKQHLIIDYAGAKVLNLDNFKKIQELTNNYQHSVLVAEYRLQAYKAGFSWGIKEYKLGECIADIYYSNYHIAVEVDRGTESHNTLEGKAKKYNELINPPTVIFFTSGASERVDTFLDSLRYNIKKAGCTFDNLNQVLAALKKKYNL